MFDPHPFLVPFFSPLHFEVTLFIDPQLRSKDWQTCLHVGNMNGLQRLPQSSAFACRPPAIGAGPLTVSFLVGRVPLLIDSTEKRNTLFETSLLEDLAALVS